MQCWSKTIIDSALYFTSYKIVTIQKRTYNKIVTIQKRTYIELYIFVYLIVTCHLYLINNLKTVITLACSNVTSTIIPMSGTAVKKSKNVSYL